MDIATVVQLIGSLGFPIVMCILKMWYIKDQSDQHKEETASFTEALNKNTLVLTKICDKLDVEADVKE